MSFGSYLRSAREDRHLSLEAIAARTKINRQLLADLEADELRRWPKPQVYRHAFIRSYAQTVGLDPDDALTRFGQNYPDQLRTEIVEVRAPAPTLLRLPRFLLHGAAVVTIAILLFALAGWPGRAEPQLPSRASDTAPQADTVAAAPVAAAAMVPTTGVIPPAEIEGELMVFSTPPDSIVTVNGIGRGKTPVRVRFLPLGAYTIRLIHQNYEIGEQRLMLTSEQPGRVLRMTLLPADGSR